MSSDENELNIWHVKFKKKGGNIYEIQLEQQQHCQHNCSIRCRACNICIHQYSCSCMDSLLQATICKHIHLLVRFLKQSNNQNTALLLQASNISSPHKILSYNSIGAMENSKTKNASQTLRNISIYT